MPNGMSKGNFNQETLDIDGKNKFRNSVGKLSDFYCKISGNRELTFMA